MSVEESQEQLSPAVPRGPSQLLTEARERLGLSQKEVADKLYLTTTFIKYIDEGEFESIPKPAFIKGYLRSYARVVELSGDEMVALYEAELQAAEPTHEMRGVTEEKVGPNSITGPVLQTGLIGLGGLALVIAFIWWLVSDSDDEVEPKITQPLVSQPLKPVIEDTDFEFVLPVEEAPVEVAQASAPDARSDGEEQQDADEPASNDPVSDEPEALAADSIPEEIALSAAETAEEATAASVKFDRTTDGTRSFVTVDAGGFDQLELSFKDECWVEITDTQYGLIYNDLNRANEILTIYGTAPFRLLLGKATGVEMIYNGRPFELERYIGGDQTAKLTVSD